MRDAFGGTFLMYLMLIVVVILVTFMTETLKYVQAFRVKNGVINAIEQYDGFNCNVVEFLEKDDGYLQKVKYSSSYTEPGGTNIPQVAGDAYANRGYRVVLEYKEGKIAYYKVTTYMTLEFTKVLIFKPITVAVSGETRYVTASNIDATCAPDDYP